MSESVSFVDQGRYQVRFEWGAAGLARLAPSDIVIVVDVLRFTSRVSELVASGEQVALDQRAFSVSLNGAPVIRDAAAGGAVVFAGALRNASAVAHAALAEQTRRATRTSIAIVAAGERTAVGADADVRFAVEDLLGAGAIIDALTHLGVDHTSPEAAAACESFRGLRGAVRHLLTASGTGQRLLADGHKPVALAAAHIDVDAVAPVLRDGIFVAA